MLRTTPRGQTILHSQATLLLFAPTRLFLPIAGATHFEEWLCSSTSVFLYSSPATSAPTRRAPPGSLCSLVITRKLPKTPSSARKTSKTKYEKPEPQVSRHGFLRGVFVAPCLGSAPTLGQLLPRIFPGRFPSGLTRALDEPWHQSRASTTPSAFAVAAGFQGVCRGVSITNFSPLDFSNGTFDVTHHLL